MRIALGASVGGNHGFEGQVIAVAARVGDEVGRVGHRLHAAGHEHVGVIARHVLRGEHQNRYRGEPHIISLEWDYEAAESLYVSALEIADSEQVELRAGLLLALGTNWRNSGPLPLSMRKRDACVAWWMICSSWRAWRLVR